jgi:excinuclease ABC subunit B
MYADVVTRSIKQAIDETERRRKIQKSYNIAHSIVPESIEKDITSIFAEMYAHKDEPADRVSEAVAPYESLENIDDIIKNLEEQMKQAAKELAFERASELRDQVKALKKMMVFEL